MPRSTPSPYRLARRDFLTTLGLSAAAAPFVLNLPSLGFGRAFASEAGRSERPAPQRLVVIFSPNGVIPKTFWPDVLDANAKKYSETSDFELTGSLAPLAPFKDQTLLLRGVDNKMQGDGDRHMRGIGCLLTGKILLPGNIQGGSDTPAGWSSGISVDQEIRNHLQASAATETRFGSLEFGVMVPDRADTWTRMVYAGSNKPIAPIDDPRRMFKKLYGRARDNAVMATVLDDVRADLAKVKGLVAAEDRAILEQHESFVRDMERQLAKTAPVGKPDGGADDAEHLGHALPEPDPALELLNDRIPEIAAAQQDLLIDAFKRDACRVASVQYTNSVGGAKMRWLGIDESHHTLSHEPDGNEDASEKLTRINAWYAEQVAGLCKQLAETPEPGHSGSMLDHTTVVWTNEMGTGNSHSLNDIPWVLVGGGLGFKTGRALHMGNVPHNRLLLSLAKPFGVDRSTFGQEDLSEGGVLSGLTA
ncbi:DUF1552 domain-containing protein [Alienimonas chondri]|uniref:DUF1552 domain-containing protein n=1 Tax=Alienimonas chondri TaxID=2681879 RepID=A0ABX1V9R2_9PLAN|nr:DUF1552 domain-containing protein [Alienimonas chondri]NNJ24834.1 hypothetical protein [Alienimonas chondri]